MKNAKNAVPQGHHTVTPVLVVSGCKEALAWYERALGATTVSTHTGPDGKIVHAEIEIGNSRIMLNDPMTDTRDAKALGGSPVSLWLYVEDCDALFARAQRAGAATTMPMADQFWGDRCGSFVDPYGLTWTVATHKQDLTPAELEERQADFFGQLAGKGR